MAKEKSVFVCENCGAKQPKWMGKCPSCGAWSTLVEEVEVKLPKNISNKEFEKYSLDSIFIEENIRYTSNMKEFDRVLGGGLVKGEVVLLTGNPGIGKSTLLLQVSEEYTKYGEVFYISGEESVNQIKYRSQRLGVKNSNIFLINETDIEILESNIKKTKPALVVIDSIQTIYSSLQDSIPGTVTQIRESTLRIIDLAKSLEIPFFIVGHITKDGKVAGPKLLEHMVDCVLQFEGEEGNYYRILRSLKNRFGSTNEIAVFNMETDGMQEVENPSEFFLSERDEKNIGSLVVPVLEGTKVFLLEVQSLLINSSFGMPRRVVQGFDRSRLEIITAIIEKKLGINLGNLDLFINIPGGIAIKDTSADLSVVISIFSVIKETAISQKIAAIGELGLRGEIRKVSFINKRLKELEKLGFTGVYVPESNRKEIENEKYKLKLIYLKNLGELMERMR
ncbi:MAG: DNA repair protein RadA [Fusobacteriaceae bacterium]|nr:DNA repair protein RadA [Fusobacteriaceae bacterium]MBP6467299.1 DNA repair protein RadA [Fusobacteriaceae bacterium]MBP9596298.1 DNA repair protein RadA [Fusobacteriaceae bacterium]MBU9917497.1 DNA repair protein RadA [Fusobacteriaceae bacterium]